MLLNTLPSSTIFVNICQDGDDWAQSHYQSTFQHSIQILKTASTDIIRIKQISRSLHVYFFKLSDHISTESHKLQRHHCYCPFVYHAFQNLMSNSPISAIYLNVLVGRIDMMWRGGAFVIKQKNILLLFALFKFRGVESCNFLHPTVL